MKAVILSDYIQKHNQSLNLRTQSKVETNDALTADHKDVQNAITKVWVEDALHRKCVISLKKLSFNEIYNLRPPPIIDPYSSLEDIGSISEGAKSDNQDAITKQETTETTEQIIGTVVIKSEYNMRTRPPRHSELSSHPHRSSGQDYKLLKSLWRCH